MSQTKHETILTPVKSFIAEQLRQHDERTEDFSRAKYEAVLHSALCAVTQKEIAKRLGLSYDVLRQWHSQDKFITKVDEALQEFALWIGKKLDGAQPPVRFGDVSEWSELAALAIARAVKRRRLVIAKPSELGAKLPRWRYPRTLAVRDMMLFEHGHQDARALWQDLISESEARERETDYKLVVNVLRNPRATSDQRKEALRVFEAIAKQSGEAGAS